MEGGKSMIVTTPDHVYYRCSINPSPGAGDLNVLFSGDAQPDGGHGIGPAIHDYCLIHTVLSGRGEFTLGEGRYHCGAGDTFIIFPGEMFAYCADKEEPWRYAWFALTGTELSAYLQAIGATPDNPVVVAGGLNTAVQHYYAQLYTCLGSSEETPELLNLEAEAWARLLLKELSKANMLRSSTAASAQDASHRVIQQAVQHLTLQYTQPISIQQLANMLGYHRTHLCKLFKRYTGLSPMQYLLNIRMTRAEHLLKTEKDMTIDQIASSVGYGDALYFSRKFHAWQGLSPSSYRQGVAR